MMTRVKPGTEKEKSDPSKSQLERLLTQPLKSSFYPRVKLQTSTCNSWCDTMVSSQNPPAPTYPTPSASSISEWDHTKHRRSLLGPSAGAVRRRLPFAVPQPWQFEHRPTSSIQTRHIRTTRLQSHMRLQSAERPAEFLKYFSAPRTLCALSKPI